MTTVIQYIEAAELYASGKTSVNQIAKRFGVHYTTVTRRFFGPSTWYDKHKTLLPKMERRGPGLPSLNKDGYYTTPTGYLLATAGRQYHIIKTKTQEPLCKHLAADDFIVERGIVAKAAVCGCCRLAAMNGKT
jgi:hypothetical protein